MGMQRRNVGVYLAKMLHRQDPECPICFEPFGTEKDVSVCRICCESMCAEVSVCSSHFAPIPPPKKEKKLTQWLDGWQHFSKKGGISICPVCRDGVKFAD